MRSGLRLAKKWVSVFTDISILRGTVLVIKKVPDVESIDRSGNQAPRYAYNVHIHTLSLHAQCTFTQILYSPVLEGCIHRVPMVIIAYSAELVYFVSA